MSWTLLLFFISSFINSSLCLSSPFNTYGFNYIKPKEYQILSNKIGQIQSFLFPDTSPIKPEFSEQQIERLPISFQCKQYLKNYQHARFNDRTWTYELEDAQGKVGYGMLKGNLEIMGDFDECVNLKVGTESDPWSDPSERGQPIFRGRYCTVAVSLKENVTQNLQERLSGFKADKVARVGLCTLTACSKDDVGKLLATKFNDDKTSISVSSCDGPEEWQLSSTPSFVRLVLGALTILLIFGTIVDRVSGSSNGEGSGENSFWMEMLQAFSVPRNLRSIWVENATPERSRFINVLKAFGMLLVLHGHGPLTIRFVSLNSITNLYFMLSGPFQAIINAGFLSVDFFLFTSAFITVKIVFPRFKQLADQKASGISIAVNGIVVFIYRYMRILPSLIFLMVMHVWSENAIGGPFWREYSDKYLSPCREQWLPNLLMLTNVLPWNPEEPNCAFHSWYLGLDMQLFIFSLVFFIILGAIKPKAAIILNLFLLGASIVTKGVMTYFYGYPPTVLFGNRERETMYFSHMYTKPWFRADPYILGLLFGYFTIKGYQIRMHNITKYAIHTLVIATMVYILKIPFHYHEVESYSTIGISMFGALHRAVWGLCLGWIFYSAYSNDFPILNSIAEWHIWEILSNVSYQFFLFHPLAYFFFFGSFRSNFSKGVFPLYVSLFGLCVTLLACTMFLPAVIEWPVANMMKIIKNRSEGKKAKKVQ